MTSTDLRIRVIPSIAEVPAAAWDACANPGEIKPLGAVADSISGQTGRRLLARPGEGAHGVRAGLAAGLVELCRMREASSVHVTFATVEEWRLLGERGFLQRTDQQFHWENGGYSSFEDFLAALASRKR